MAQGPILAALAVLVEGDHVLLVRRRNEPDAGLWGFPGGRVEPGETVFAAAERELAEETGVDAEAREFLTVIDVIRRQGGALAYHYALAAVLCARRATAGSPEPAAADDAVEAAWVPLGDVLAGLLTTSEGVPEVVRLTRERVAGVCAPRLARA
jgi:ADP-ribose pyrophosphatase YjhB (NUDIX family)